MNVCINWRFHSLNSKFACHVCGVQQSCSGYCAVWGIRSTMAFSAELFCGSDGTIYESQVAGCTLKSNVRPEGLLNRNLDRGVRPTQ